VTQLDDFWLLRAEAAAYLRLSVSTLAHLASDGMGPRFYKARNRVRYLKSDLDAWAKSAAYEPFPPLLQQYIADKGRTGNFRKRLRAR